MAFFEQAVTTWEQSMVTANARPWSQKLREGKLGLPHYKGFLMETYHNAGLNPQLQGFATFYLKNRPRLVTKKFFQHAISEIGHDLLALNDLKTLGVGNDFVLASSPLAETKAFFATAVYNIQKYGPVSYLAYLFYLEYTPVQNGPGIMALLKQKGIPDVAMSFLHEHSSVDVQHLKLMRTYMDEVIDSKEAETQFSDDLKDYIVLHTHMIEAAFENGERLFP